MIKLKGNQLIITGKDEANLKRVAKKFKVSREVLIVSLLEAMMKKYRFIESNIMLEQIS